MTVLGLEMKKERKARGWSQVLFAQLLRVSQDAVYYWETKDILPQPLLLIEIENAFGWHRGYSLQLIERGEV